jgi:decaprenyl-phosphate phosphoribosyltransferase
VDPSTDATGDGVTRRPRPQRRRPSSVGGSAALLRATRPRQWLKNALVFAAPATSGAIVHAGPFARTLAAFGIFVAASACTYLVNDVVDRESDLLHPVKRLRPIAAGLVTTRQAVTVAIVLGAAAIAAGAVISAALAAIVVAYLVISLAYSFALKHVPIIELACVGSGFTLRAVAGGAAAHVPISPWFLLVTSFGALFVVAGKRTSEQQLLGDDQAAHRSALASYPVGFLRSVRVLAMSVTVTTYCLWAFERAADLRPADHAEDLVWFELSIIPFVLAVLAVELAISRGRGGEPEELALTDRLLQLLAVVWLALLLCGIYA